MNYKVSSLRIEKRNKQISKKFPWIFVYLKRLRNFYLINFLNDLVYFISWKLLLLSFKYKTRKITTKTKKIKYILFYFKTSKKLVNKLNRLP